MSRDNRVDINKNSNHEWFNKFRDVIKIRSEDHNLIKFQQKFSICTLNKLTLNIK